VHIFSSWEVVLGSSRRRVAGLSSGLDYLAEYNMTVRTEKCTVENHFESVADLIPGSALVSPIAVLVDEPSAPGF
jgi:hypothetical protein